MLSFNSPKFIHIYIFIVHIYTFINIYIYSTYIYEYIKDLQRTIICNCLLEYWAAYKFNKR